MNTKEYITNTATCFGAHAPTLGSSDIVIAKVIKYYLFHLLVTAVHRSEGKDADCGVGLLWVFTQNSTGLPSPNIVRVMKSRRMR
jgi:hypothetical protein